jgi:hypothetical protein
MAIADNIFSERRQHDLHLGRRLHYTSSFVLFGVFFNNHFYIQKAGVWLVRNSTRDRTVF